MYGVKKGQLCKGIVEDLAFPNKGKVRIVEVEGESSAEGVGEIATVKNCLVGQMVEFRITKKRTGKVQGNLVNVLKRANNERLDGICKHFEVCGGCLYQSLGYEDQIELKCRQVRSLLSPVVGEDRFDELFEGVIRSPKQFGYRNKMEYSFGDEIKDGPLTLGMHKRGSFYDVVTVDDCRIVDEDYRLILKTTLDFFSSRGMTYYHKVRHEGYLRHLLVRKASKSGEILICLVTSSDYRCGDGESDFLGNRTKPLGDEGEMLSDYKDMLLALDLTGKIVGILHTRNDDVADVVKDKGTTILYGKSYIVEEILGLTFKITPFSFFQTNSLGAELLYSKAREFIKDSLGGSLDKLKGAVLYDLYSGTGTIAQIMAPVADKVVGVEIVEEAVDAAIENAKENGLVNCEFIAGDVLKVLDDIEVKPDYIILDPPRDGINPKALRKIIEYNVENMIYVSCKPTSLARDLVTLQSSGYEVRRVCCVDMFPGTGHVESVVLLSNWSNIELYSEVSCIYD